MKKNPPFRHIRPIEVVVIVLLSIIATFFLNFCGMLYGCNATQQNGVILARAEEYIDPYGRRMWRCEHCGEENQYFDNCCQYCGYFR